MAVNFRESFGLGRLPCAKGVLIGNKMATPLQVRQGADELWPNLVFEHLS